MAKEIDHLEVVQKVLEGEDSIMKEALVFLAEGLYHYNRYYESEVKKACGDSRKCFQNSKKMIDVLRKKILEHKKGSEA